MIFAACCDGLSGLADGEIGPADVHVDQGREWVERQSVPAGRNGLVDTPLEGEEQRVVRQGLRALLGLSSIDRRNARSAPRQSQS